MFLYEQANMIDQAEDLHMQRMINLSDCKHVHDFLELVFVEQGSMYHFINDKIYKVNAGDIIACFPGQTHSFFAHQKGPVFYINFLIRIPNQWTNKALADAIENFMQIYQRLEQVPILSFNEGQSKAYHFDVQEMLKLYQERPPTYQNLLRQQLIHLLTAGVECRKESGWLNNEASSNLPRKIVECLEKRFSPTITLNELAEDLCYDTGYLTKNFKKYFGITITDYIQQMRMDMARYLLWSTDIPIDEISKLVGYNNKTFFYKIFTEYIGLSPSETRKVFKQIVSRFSEP